MYWEEVEMRGNKGFTLIEVLVGMFLLCVVLLGMAGYMTAVLSAEGSSKKLSTAMVYLQDKTEYLRVGSPYALMNGSDTLTNGNLEYQRSWEISSPSNNLRMITVSVNWYDKGNLKTANVSTVRAE
jgi:prepilin-type N-terminal cleavage/methylation domain-containing protein